MSPVATAIVALTAMTLLVVLDVYLATDRRRGNTYSELLTRLGKIWPPIRLLLSFGMGLLAAHWWRW